MSYSRDQLLAAARAHAVWPRTDPRPEDPRYVRYDAVCSCGHEQLDTDWLDDVVQTDLADHGPYVIAYPLGDFDETMGGVQVALGRWGDLVDAADLEWLLAQPDLPDEFRRAAAVHLPG